jgi:hypothetical protein
MIKDVGIGAVIAAGLLSAACGKVNGDPIVSVPDASSIPHDIDASPPDAPPPLGSKARPARSCTELQVALAPSGAYWLAIPGGDALETYCDQDTNGGGWAMVYNSVHTDGKTLLFWQFAYADRWNTRGTPAPDQNFYAGGLYKLGTNYMDVITDLQGKSAVAMIASTTGIDPDTMRFAGPSLVSGNASIYDNQFAGGWSSADQDGDDYSANCASTFANVAQHYKACWVYNLGADADMPYEDSGVGPHVNIAVLSALGLARQPNPTGSYDQVGRIARFARW